MEGQEDTVLIISLFCFIVVGKRHLVHCAESKNLGRKLFFHFNINL